jgi:hypothetical protein
MKLLKWKRIKNHGGRKILRLPGICRAARKRGTVEGVSGAEGKDVIMDMGRRELRERRRKPYSGARQWSSCVEGGMKRCRIARRKPCLRKEKTTRRMPSSTILHTGGH